LPGGPSHIPNILKSLALALRGIRDVRGAKVLPFARQYIKNILEEKHIPFRTVFIPQPRQ
jgi:hypothetical protein